MAFEKSTAPTRPISPQAFTTGLPYLIFENTGDLDGDGVYTPAVSFDFAGLECSGACEATTSVEAVVGGSSSDGSTDRTMAIAIGSAVSGVGVTALIIVGAILMRRRRRGTNAKAVEPAENEAPIDPNAPAPVPVFEVRTIN